MFSQLRQEVASLQKTVSSLSQKYNTERALQLQERQAEVQSCQTDLAKLQQVISIFFQLLVGFNTLASVAVSRSYVIGFGKDSVNTIMMLNSEYVKDDLHGFILKCTKWFDGHAIWRSTTLIWHVKIDRYILKRLHF